jgi:hypothetical protein
MSKETDDMAYFYQQLADGRKAGQAEEQKRIIDLLLNLNAVRRCGATNKLVAFDTNGENVIYLTGLETDV